MEHVLHGFRPVPAHAAAQTGTLAVLTFGDRMKSLHRLLIVALAALPLAALAQPAPKVFTVDIAKAFEAHPQTKVQQAALKADEQKANEQLKKMENDARALAGKLRDQQTKFDDPTIAASQKEAIRTDAQKTAQELQTEQTEAQQLLAKTDRDMQQRAMQTRGQIIGDIAKAAGDVAKRKGGTLVYDRNQMLYADAAYDITSDVIAEITKAGRPAAPAPTPTPAPTK
jgi:outer membrane protein